MMSRLIILLLILSSSCTGQDTPAKQQLRSTPTAPAVETNTNDSDPYFIETKYIDIKYGPQSITRSILQASDGTIWLATWEGILSYDGSIFTNHTNKEKLRRWHVFAAREDSRGNIWFGTIGAGLYVLMGGNTFENLNTSDGLAYDRTGCIFEDNNGVMWIGTERGISKFDGQGFENFFTEEGGDNDDINAIIQDREGKLWVGARGNAHFFDGENFTLITRANGSSFINVRSIIMDRQGKIWLGGNDGLWRYSDGVVSQINTDFTGYIFEDSKGDVWTSSEVDGGTWKLSRYDMNVPSSGTLTATEILREENMFFGIEEDKDGRIWLGTLYGAYRIDSGTVEKFRPE